MTRWLQVRALLAHRVVASLLLLAASLPLQAEEADVPEGHLQEAVSLPSRHVQERPVRVWLPPDYAEAGRRYPVLYMHDGQNVFARANADSAGFGSWDADLAMERLIANGDIRAAIIVAIDNTGNRGGEYMPQAAYWMAQASGRKVGSSHGVAVEDIQSDNYLKFIVEELKPYIDRRYRTAAGREDTYIMGSSMGGLISLYAISEYPEVFGGAACLSTHWPIGDGIAVEYVRDHLPDAATHRLYFDRGTETLDASYGPHQTEVDHIARRHGYASGRNFESLVLAGAEHNERSWAKRLEVPLKFLLGTEGRSTETESE